MYGSSQWYMAIGGHQVGPVTQEEIIANLLPICHSPELDIVVRVLKVRGKAVSVGIEAPRGIRIVRSELETRDFGDREATWGRELAHAGV